MEQRSGSTATYRQLMDIFDHCGYNECIHTIQSICGKCIINCFNSYSFYWYSIIIILKAFFSHSKLSS